MSGVKDQSQDFIDIFSDPAGMAKSLSNIAWEIAEDPVAAGLKYGFNTADALSESSALYLKALANNDYVTAGEYMGRFAMDMAIALGTAEAGSAVEGAVFGAREAEALKAIEKVEQSVPKRPPFIVDVKIEKQMSERGWTQQDLDSVIAKGPAGKTTDNRRPNKTDDGLGRNDSATVYGSSGNYVIVNDRTGEIV